MLLFLQKKFEGTKVTVESFLAWKTKFEAEIDELKAKKLKENPEPKGLTGEYALISGYCLTALLTAFH